MAARLGPEEEAEVEANADPRMNHQSLARAGGEAEVAARAGGEEAEEHQAEDLAQKGVALELAGDLHEVAGHATGNREIRVLVVVLKSHLRPPCYLEPRRQGEKSLDLLVGFPKSGREVRTNVHRTE